MHIFDKETKSQASQGWRLLILDSHSSHLNIRFIEYCDKNQILLAIFPAHATHTLQPLDVALFQPLSKAYTDELNLFIHNPQGLSRIQKRNFFRLFWASWKAAFIKQNILSAFKNTGLYPFDPDLVIHHFIKKERRRPTSSESNISIIPANDWRQLHKTVSKAVNNIYDKKAQQLNATLQYIATENTLLKSEIKGIKNTLITIQKRQVKAKPLLLNLPLENDGGALFIIPSKVQQVQEIQIQKDQSAAQEQARKDHKKLQQRLTKKSKEAKKAKKPQIQQEKQEQRAQEAAEKQHHKDKQELAKLANLQLQNNVIQLRSLQKEQKSQFLSKQGQSLILQHV